MDIHLERENNGYAVHLRGPITLRVDDALVKQALKVAMRHRIAGNDDYAVAGFWDTIRKGLGQVTQITKNPLVRAAASVIPYGSTALSAVDMAHEGAKLADKAMRKRPHAARLVKRAARKDPAALAQIRQIKQAAKAGRPEAAAALRSIAQVAAIAADRQELTRYIRRSNALPPGYQYQYE